MFYFNKILSIIFLVNLLSTATTYANETCTEILLIRHGETDWNVEKRMQGHTDNPLNATGIAQAESLAQKMLIHHNDIALTVYSSDLQRAVVTAQKTMEAFENAGIGTFNLVQFESLREYNWGEAEGLLSNEKKERYQEQEQKLLEKYPDRKDRWNYTVIPGSETLNELVARTKKAMTEIAANHPGEKVAVFVHGRLINSLISDVDDLQENSLKLPNCGVVHFRYYSESPDNPIEFIKVENLLQQVTPSSYSTQ